MHSLLKRQLKRCFGEGFQVPAEFREFLDAVDSSYREFDADREMVERSLELSSQELLEANSEMRGVFQAIPDLLFRIDRQGTILAFKAGATGDLMVQRNELFGRRIQDFPAKAISAQFTRAIAEVLSSRSLQSFEYPLIVQGRECFYEARLVPLPEEQIVVIIQNITERKQAEKNLRETVSLLQSTLESTVDGILVVDADGRIVLFNKRFVSLWRLPDHILASRDDAAALAYVVEQLKDPEEFLRGVRELYKTPEANSFDTLEFKDGRVFERDSSPHLLDGVPIGRVWTFHDITEHKELEAQLRQSQKMQAFGQLAGGVAHDFNNILTVIKGNISLFRGGRLSKVEEDTLIEQAYQAAERAANLTRQLLTFSRRQPIQRKDLDLNEVVANMTRMLQRLIGEHIALEAFYSPGNMPINADPGMMEQALVNLAVNSRDAMPNGGRLILQTALVKLSETDAQANSRARPGEFVRLSVRDTGCGIAPENLPFIFEPFFTTKDVGKGTGLGLATVFGIVEQHSGWIDVESQINSGTTFHIYLPALDSVAIEATKESAARELRGGSETILFVEDEENVRELMQNVLERFGYRVHSASSGVEALKLWSQHKESVDLLVTDMIMPGGIGGRELAELLLPDKPQLKALFCSGYTDDMLGPDSHWCADTNFLNKPFDLEDFLRKVRTCLDKT
jgi:signal transduction histidine kinase/ActR/RegA family two-component response regulator